MPHGLRLLASFLSLALPLAAQATDSSPPRRAPSLERLRTASAELDRLLADDLSEHRLRPTERIDDEAFCRRAYLSITGRIPTLAELEDFVAERGAGKREALTDRLLASPGHVSHSFNRWADILRVQSRMMRGTSGEPYAHHLKQALAENRPYDELVRGLLTATGPAHARDNGATGYLLRDLGMPLDNLANTMRVFLGTRMECAQCHDHPFDTWTQRQFYELAAFTGGLRYTSERGAAEPRALQAQVRELRQQYGEEVQRVLLQLRRQVGTGIGGSGSGALALPKDYQYDDARPGQVVHAKVPFGTAPAMAEPQRLGGRRPVRPARGERDNAAQGYAEIGSREAFAAWVTSPENPRFTRVIVNRLWQAAFGRALHEPVDDFREDTVLAQPAIFAFLERTLREFDYDLRALESVLYRSELFSRRAVAVPEESDAPFRFAGPALRRLSAEQIWDSVLTLGIGDPDVTLTAPGAKAEPVYREYDSLLAQSAEGIEALVERERLRTTDPAEYRRLRAKDLAGMAGTSTETRPAADAVREQVRELTRALAEARKARDRAKVEELTKQLEELRAQAARAAVARNRELARASELPQPSRPGHFLREFGQSDRDQIDASSSEANVPQALRLLNGLVDQQLLAQGTAVMRALASESRPAERIRLAWRTILSRAPEPDELALWRRDLEHDLESGTRDLVWALVNCQEFRFLE